MISVDDCLAREHCSSSAAQTYSSSGANAIDLHGNAALMYGAPLGGPPATVLAGLMGEIPNVFIAAGLEKLVPGSLADIVGRVGRRGVDLSMGMAVGLTPVSRRIISEDVAIPLLAKVTSTVIGRGGLFGSPGATTLLVEGETREVNTIFDIAESVKGSGVSGLPSSLEECSFPNERCSKHLACILQKAGCKKRRRQERNNRALRGKIAEQYEPSCPRRESIMAFRWAKCGEGPVKCLDIQHIP